MRRWLGLAFILPIGAHAFTHPGVLVSRVELDFFKQQVAAGAQPWKGAFDQLKASSSGSLSFQAKPRAAVECGSGGQPDNGCSDETRDSHAAYAHALLWAASGDARYAQKCAEILDAWSAVLKSHGMSNAPLQVGWTGGGFIRAAEILRATYPQWPKASIDRFTAMLNTAMLPLVQNGQGSSTNGNWETAETEVLISIAVFEDNQALFDKALALYRKRLPAYIYAKEDGPVPLTVDPAKFNTTQKIIDHWQGQKVFMDGLCQETCRDLRHVQHGIASQIFTAEIAWRQGVDLYAERNNRLVTGMEFHARWVLGEKPPADLCGGTLTSTQAMPAWEILYNHYHNRRRLAMPQTEQVIGRFSPEGAVQHMMWGTLSHHGAGTGEGPLALGPRARPQGEMPAFLQLGLEADAGMRVYRPGRQGLAVFDMQGRLVTARPRDLAPAYLLRAK